MLTVIVWDFEIEDYWPEFEGAEVDCTQFIKDKRLVCTQRIDNVLYCE